MIRRSSLRRAGPNLVTSPPGQSGTHLVVQNDRRRRVRLDRRVGGGGEAEVYQLRGRSKVLAKVYRAPPSPDYRTKLEWMMQHPPTLSRRTQHVAIAWPTGLLFDGTMDLVGFLMPGVDAGLPLITAFNPRRRAKALPRFDRRLAFQAAHNLAQIVGDLHAAGYVVGDLNESNVLVTENARISLIDIDSFQVRIPTAGTVVTYRSLVGKPEYTPPELQGVNFRSVDRSDEHDRFALAVLIFQLLMEGNHPFSVQWRGTGDPPTLERAIREGMYPYAPTTHPIQVPPGAPGIETLDVATADLFRQCFVTGHTRPDARPTGHAWASALAAAEQSLAKCRKGHRYASHLASCPYCHASQNRTRKRAPSVPSEVGARSGKAPPPFGGVAPPAAASVLGKRAAPRRPSPSPSLARKAAPPDQKRMPTWLWLILGIAAILIVIYL
jgi:DNA-binding helix-hairpin-helix protein with protein kinase domain